MVYTITTTAPLILKASFLDILGKLIARWQMTLDFAAATDNGDGA